MTVLEICLDDLDGVAVAEAAGADRVELCAALSEGGLTPSIGTVTAALAMARHLGVQVLVRQRAGDFVYSRVEIDAMVADITAISALPRPQGVRLGFVIGALKPSGGIDGPAVAALVEAAGDAPVTFHKAFDQCPDLVVAVDQLVALGVGRVLTSGGELSAREGARQLAKLVAHAGGRIVILAGGGIRPDHVADLVRDTGVSEVHLRAGAPVASAAYASATRSSLTAGLYDTGERVVTSGEVVCAMRAALDEMP